MPKLISILLILVIFTLTTAKPGPSEEAARNANGFVVHKGLVYSSVNGKLKMDLYLPRKTARAVLCVIVIQGGGFRAQDGQRFRPFAEHLADNGFAAALIAYRGQPDHTYKATIADTKAAVRFVRKISSRYGIDPDRIGAMGRSAGATLTALLAVTGGVAELEGDGGHPQFSSRIQAAVGIAGVYDFVARFTVEEQKSLQPKLGAKLKSNGEWIGAPFSPANEHWLRASAINHVDANDPPMLLIHSKNDQTVPWMQSRDMYKEMTEASVKSEFELSETGGHGGPPNAKELLITFFRKVLIKQNSPAAAAKPHR